MRYLEIFDLERKFQGHKLHRVESMDYDTQVFKFPDIFKQAMLDMLDHHTLSYSDFGGFPRTIDLIKQYEQSRTGLISDCTVFVGAGVSSLILPVLRAVQDIPTPVVRDEVVLFAPDYSIFESAVAYLGLRPVVVPGKREYGFLVDEEDVAKHISERTLAVLFSNPNNPLCRTYSNTFIRRLCECCEMFGAFILSDEIYCESMFQGNEFPNTAAINGSYNRLVRFFGPSKDRPGFTGLRAGYCIGDKILERGIRKHQVLSSFSSNIIADYLFLVDLALRHLKLTGVFHPELKHFSENLISSYHTDIFNNNSRQKEYCEFSLSLLNKNKNVADYVKPDCGNGIVFQFKSDIPMSDFGDEMVRKGIIAYPGSVFHFDQVTERTWSRLCVTKSRPHLCESIALL